MQYAEHELSDVHEETIRQVIKQIEDMNKHTKLQSSERVRNILRLSELRFALVKKLLK